MGLIAKDEGGTFKPCPEGLHAATCCDVVDLGMMDSTFGGTKHKCRIVWLTDMEDEETKKCFSVSRMYTVSLNEKASLRRDLESWRGRKFTAEELKGFDLERLIGVPAQVNVVHNERDGKTYGNVQTVVPLGKGMEKPDISAYVRWEDRDPKDAANAPEEQYDDVPF